MNVTIGTINVTIGTVNFAPHLAVGCTSRHFLEDRKGIVRRFDRTDG
jgi:hypothetical protein